MTYQQALTFIHSLDRFGSRPGLDRVRELFGFTPKILDQSFIHVAGTNGKGSVCTMLSHILAQAGYKTGLFISPYITDFCERIQINNQPIDKDILADTTARYRPYLEELRKKGVIITEFEFLTVVAFAIFKEQNCDLVVCEVGMGGLLDSTNVITRPLCSVITRIDLDHTAVLGDTIEQIAAQKCGIIKAGAPVAVAAQDERAAAVICAAADASGDLIYYGEDVPVTVTKTDRNGVDFDYLGQTMHLPLVGAHQVDNLRCALAAIRALPFEIDPDTIRTGLCAVRHPARLECLHRDPAVILDGAHNNNGMAAFASAVRTFYPDSPKTLIVGMLADKDSDSLHHLSGLFTRMIATNVDNPRALSAEELADRLRDLCGDVTVICSPQDAFDRALTYGDDIFICGSLYLASEVRPYIIART